MRKIVIGLVLFIITVIFSGCQGQVPNNLAGLLGDQSDLLKATATIDVVDEKIIKNEVKHQNPDTNPPVNYYPDAGLPSTAMPSVVLTDKLKMKLYLVDRYKPGTCFGQPAELSSEEITTYLQQNFGLDRFVRDHYGIISDLEAYSKVKQIMAVSLRRGSGGKYLYRFIDGQCCDLITFEGEIEIINVNIFETLLKHSTKKTSC